MKPNIVGIWGAPRTGTSWLGQIFDSSPDVRYQMAPFYSWNFRDKLTVRSTELEIEEYFLSVYNSEDRYLRQLDRREQGIYPIWNKKNEKPNFLTFKEVTCIYLLPNLMKNSPNMKSVALVRNPYDQMKSWINNEKEFHSDWPLDEEWYFGQRRNELQAESYFGFHKWKEATMTFFELEKEFKERFLIVEYEKLNENPLEQVKQIFDFCKIPLGAQTEEFIQKSSSTFVANPFSVYRKHGESNPLNTKEVPDYIKDIIEKELEYFEPAQRFAWNRR